MVPYNDVGDEVSHVLRERLEVRLDAEHRRKLTEITARRGAPISVIVRDMIDQAYEEVAREERLRAAREIAQFEIEDVPDPDELSRQLDSTHDLPDLH
jgi:hypothetical protein